MTAESAHSGDIEYEEWERKQWGFSTSPSCTQTTDLKLKLKGDRALCSRLEVVLEVVEAPALLDITFMVNTGEILRLYHC